MNTIFYKTGKRKTAIARVFLSERKDKVVNGKNIQDYFPTERDVLRINRPLRLFDLADELGFYATVKGGGTSAQAQALSLGIAKALVERFDNSHTHKKALRQEGLITRDSRIVERKKVGLHKARKSPQYSKR